ncbi:hypothetical protein [Acetobacter malorum]|uniref:hypothetical protein n=1 Tax=Acetobacter malorum TaxID=178901 RepID=UPI0012E97AE0|nr:hypothetical protein [Acetobacter malorum]
MSEETSKSPKDLLIHNESLKLRATSYNIGAVSCFTVGILTPLAGMFTGLIPLDDSHLFRDIIVLLQMIFYAMAASRLRSIATQFLEGLEA